MPKFYVTKFGNEAADKSIGVMIKDMQKLGCLVALNAEKTEFEVSFRHDNVKAFDAYALMKKRALRSLLPNAVYWPEDPDQPTVEETKEQVTKHNPPAVKAE